MVSIAGSRRHALAALTALAATAGCAAATPSAPRTQRSPAPATTMAAPPAPASIAAPAAGSSLGELSFPVTGSPECQRLFREGMLAMHSFLYDQAHESFSAALAADGRCAMAAWGDAMTYDHPIWHGRDRGKGRAALARATHEEALSPKERAYLAAARALFLEEDDKAAHAAWLAAAEQMHRDFPADDEVQLQHALALLYAYAYDPKHVRGQMEAGALALEVLQRRPEHPGAAHYVIHAFDSRDHAILALPAARTYARIAPAAGHAQHMPSHTFTHLGMWREVVPSNERAVASASAWAKAHAQSPSYYDWHAYSWLVAAHLELGQWARARQLVDEARALVVEANDDEAAGFRFDYANLVAAYVTRTERWSDVEALVQPVFAPALNEGSGARGPVACAAHAPGGTGESRAPVALVARITAHALRAEALLHAGDRDGAEKRVADMKAVRAQMAAWSKTLPPELAVRAEAFEDSLVARARALAGQQPEAQRKAIESLERLVGIDAPRAAAGPAWLKTSRETLAQALLAAGRPKEALAQLENDLDARPNRATALLGAARAAAAAGDAAKARAHYAALASLWRDADANLAALGEARAGAK